MSYSTFRWIPDFKYMKQQKGFFFIITAVVLWASTAPLAKYLFIQGLSPAALVQMRNTLAFFGLLGMLAIFRKDLLRITKKDLIYFALLGVLGLSMVQFTYFYAISKINVGVAVSLHYLAPTFIVLYNFFFLKKKPNWKTGAAVILALTGCYLVIGAYEVPLSELNWEGVLVGIISAVAYAFNAIYGEKVMQKYKPWTVFVYGLLFATLFWNVIYPPLELVGQEWSWNIWGWIWVVAMFGTLLPFSLFYMALEKLEPVRLTIISTLEPVFATGIAFLMLGESLGGLQLGGGIFILGSVVLVALERE